jgi:hypothetical protein
MSKSQKKKEELKQASVQDVIKKASQQTAEKCMNEIGIILETYNCTLEVKHVQDVIMGQPVLKYGVVVVHHVESPK